MSCHSAEVARVAPEMSGRQLARTLSGLGTFAARDMAVDRQVFDLVSARVDGWAGGFHEDELRFIAEGRRKFNSAAVSSNAGGTPVYRGTAGDTGGTPVYRGTAGEVVTRERERWISVLVGPGKTVLQMTLKSVANPRFLTLRLSCHPPDVWRDFFRALLPSLHSTFVVSGFTKIIIIYFWQNHQTPRFHSLQVLQRYQILQVVPNTAQTLGALEPHASRLMY